jgi:fructose-specific phosphotransferase system IIA component
MNSFLELLEEENIIYQLEASSREDVIKKLVQHCIDNGDIEPDKSEKIVELLINRENTMSTGIGSGVAIPHCSTDLVNKLHVVLGISKDGVEFNASDNRPVFIFVMMIVPRDKFQNHIKTLALVAKTLNAQEERDKLIDSKNFSDVQAALLKGA